MTDTGSFAYAKVILVLGSLAVFLINMVATIDDEWSLVRLSDKVLAHRGLWDDCPNTFAELCPEEDWLLAARGFSVLSCIFSFVAVILVVIGVLKVKSLSMVGTVFLFLSMLSMIITVALFTDNEKKIETYLTITNGSDLYYRGYCYVLGWVSIIFCLGTALGALMMSACRRDMPNKEEA